LKANERLLIIGPPVTGDYWDNQVKPYLGDQIEYVGYVPREKLFSYYQKAKALLVPIMWSEPFGLVMVEALACGTPVIAFNRGSAPEIIENGRNGFIVEDVDQMVEALRKVHNISRRECRRTVEEKFTTAKMVDGYEAAFLDILSRCR
jgi:glycosyltransferase involved in cell wall biosynthesis